MKIIDVSRSLDTGTGHWPTDTPFSFVLTNSRAVGDDLNVGTMTLSTHFGTHVDAPFHFSDSKMTIDQLDLEVFYGEVLVIEAAGQPEIKPSCVPQGQLPARVLFRTGAWSRDMQFPSKIPVLNLETVDRLARGGVKLVGVDVPSVDLLESKELAIHHALTQAGILILESLWLEDVAPGTYTLAAFPLKLIGGDAAAVRAVLLRD
jgi:arylformamidase